MGSCCGEVVSVAMPVEGEFEVVAFCSVGSVNGVMETVGSGSVMSCSWSVLAACCSFWLLESGGGEAGRSSQSWDMWPLALHFLQTISGHCWQECPTSLRSLHMGCWLLCMILHHSSPILIE